MQGADPLGAAAAARELARHDDDAIFRGFLDGTALRETDAGDVPAASIVLQWMVANDAMTEPSPAAPRAIRRQFVAPPAAAAPARGGLVRATPPEPELPAEPRVPENGANVEVVYFRAAYGVGVGGMMVMRFEPLILLRDGTTCEVAAAAREDVDLTAERVAKPRRFGRWTRAGDTFMLTDDRGRADTYKLQDGRFFRAFPAGPAETLAQSYRNLSGGGNTAMGGDVMIAVSNRYDSRADGTYGRGGSVGSTNSGATSGVGSAITSRRAAEGGRYALDRHTLTLTAPDGRVRRRFFAFASHGDPPAIVRDMLFVGDDAFTPPHSRTGS